MPETTENSASQNAVALQFIMQSVVPEGAFAGMLFSSIFSPLRFHTTKAMSRHVSDHAASSSSKALASFRSTVSKPSVNQP